MDQQVDLDVENLFNDSGDLNQESLDQILPTSDHNVLQSQNVTPTPGLIERIVALVDSGCVARVVWSRQGHVARITEDGTTVYLHCLRTIPATGLWTLSEARPLPAIFDNATSLTFSRAGTDLAVIDTRGRVSLFCFSTTSLNQLDELRSGLLDQPEELGQPIGAWWFYQDRQERPRIVIPTATRKNEKWAQSVTKARTLGPLYPKAFTMIDRQGYVTVFYIAATPQYHKASVQLPVPPSSIFTHAAISPTTEGKLMIALYSCTGKLSVYYVQVAWPPANEWKSTGGGPHPTLSAEVIDNDVPVVFSQPDSNDNNIGQSFNPSDWALTHLEIVPTSDVDNSMQFPPTIWAVFASLSRMAGSTDTGFLQASTIRRWAVSSIDQKLQSVFDAIPTKAEATQNNHTTLHVTRLPDTSFPQFITAVDLLDYGQMVGITTSDGRTEIWNPSTMSPASFEGQPDEVTSMAQAGFSFNLAASQVPTTLSSNACIAVSSNTDSAPILNQASYLGQTGQNIDIQDPQQSAAVASLVLTFSRACYSNVNTDDLLCCIATTYHASQVPTIMSTLYRNSFRETDLIHEKAPNSESGKIFSNQMLGKAFSFNLALLSSASSHLQAQAQTGMIPPITWARLWTWISINFRYITQHLSFFIREVQNGTVLPDSYVNMICNSCKWCLEVYTFIVSSILEVGDRSTNPDMFDPPTSINNLGDDKGDGSQGIVALLLNCQWSRVLLATLVNALRAFVEKYPHSLPPIGRVADTVHRYSTKRGLNLVAVEKLLDGRSYVRNGLAEHEALDNTLIAKRQIEMMSSGIVGQYYQDTIRRLLDSVINSEDGLRTRGEIQRLKLFTNATDLEFIFVGMGAGLLYPSSSPTSTSSSVKTQRPNSQKRNTYYDVHKKNLVHVDDPETQLVRRCTRCGSLSEDVEGMNREWSRKLMTYMSRCVCDGYWVLETFKVKDGK